VNPLRAIGVGRRWFVLIALVTSGASQLPLPGFDRPREIQTSPSDNNLRSLRVATWNIDRGVHLDVIGSELERNPADLLLLQEVDWNTKRAGHTDVARVLAQRLHLNGSFAIEFEELGQEQFEELSQEQSQPAFIGQATLTRLPIRRSRVLRFHAQSGFWKPRGWLPSSLPLMQRRLGNRVALVTELTFAGRLLVVYNAHLESRSYGRIQSAQLDEMLADARRYPAGTAILLGGDLNTKYLPSFFLKKLERAGFSSSLGQRIERTHAIAMALDWMFVKGPIQVKDGQVRRGFQGSDHYPVYALIQPH
jgi:endonuclease/exonuclease/phosphatase family metal-dependent hydrolase